jgi:hypothetical protein
MKNILLSAIYIIANLFISPVFAANAKIANYLGEGHYPRLQLKLSANAQGWNPFTIDYQGTGAVPTGPAPKNWSTWNVIDENNIYYGTLTLLSSTGDKIILDSYQPNPDNIHYLIDLKIEYDAAKNVNNLSVGGVHPVPAGPFPDAPIATPAVDAKGQRFVLSVKGPDLIDNHGNKVLLKGLVRPSLEWDPQGQFLSEKDIINMKKWGINVIRLDLNQSHWFASEPKTVKGSYKQIIDAIIYYATQNQMAVILDLHWLSNNQDCMPNNNSLRFWKEIAEEYKNFGSVIFELYNEPFFPGDVPLEKQYDIWKNGQKEGAIYKYVGHQLLLDTVRATGANNICIVNGLDYGYLLNFLSPDSKYILQGVNIMYGSHPYNYKGIYEGTFEENYKGIRGKYPLIFTEFGVNSPLYYQTGEYAGIYEDQLKEIQKDHINYTGFAWWVGQPHFPALISDWSGAPQYGGLQVKQDLTENPPTNFLFHSE